MKPLTPPYYILHFGRVADRAGRAEQELARAALDRDATAVAMRIEEAIALRPGGSPRLAVAVGAQIRAYDELHELVRELLLGIEDAKRDLDTGGLAAPTRTLLGEIQAAEADVDLARLWLRCIVGLAMRHPDECRRAIDGNLHRDADAREVRAAGQIVDVIPWVETDMQLEPDWCPEAP